MDCSILIGNLDKGFPRERVKFIEEFYGLEVCEVQHEDDFVQKLDRYQSIKIVVLSLTHLTRDDDLIGPVQAARMISPDSFVVVILNRKVSQKGIDLLIKNGASIVISSDEVQKTSILEFIITSYLKGQWFSFKTDDLRPGVIMPFSLYHLMSANQEFIPVIFQGDVLSDSKVERLKKIPELFYHRSKVESVNQYIKQLSLEGSEALNRRCRLYFQNAWIGYQDFILYAFDYGHHSNLEMGNQRWITLKRLSEDFVMSLASASSLDFVLDRSVLTMTHPIQVSLLANSLASYLSLMLLVGDPVVVFLTGLISDMGLVEVPYTGLKGLVNKEIHIVDPVAMDTYEKRNRLSLQRLGRLNVPLDPSIRELVTMQNTKFSDLNRLKISPNKLAVENQLLLFGDLVARSYLIQEGYARLTLKESIKNALTVAQKENLIRPDLSETIEKILNNVG